MLPELSTSPLSSAPLGWIQHSWIFSPSPEVFPTTICPSWSGKIPFNGSPSISWSGNFHWILLWVRRRKSSSSFLLPSVPAATKNLKGAEKKELKPPHGADPELQCHSHRKFVEVGMLSQNILPTRFVELAGLQVAPAKKMEYYIIIWYISIPFHLEKNIFFPKSAGRDLQLLLSGWYWYRIPSEISRVFLLKEHFGSAISCRSILVSICGVTNQFTSKHQLG